MIRPAANNLKALLVPIADAMGKPDFSDRERQVFDRLRRGLGRKSIARELGVTPGCIAGYCRSICRKLGISDPPPPAQLSRQANIPLP
ncbi:LuxR C-terminal-related transcriptional regulator [Luteolibacter sp. SL250]|uniref:LuxR C-terminal-related transcriptional regulator n=1 Tax=Luteolibacter sp. SL250 TaxID=2995170 RepID=UPI00226EA011|nr:LuxR C-terminal-related transcriptional regulator [Luteolibacter sp. SL250]WAC20923.1 LuxR C-terminal-related transcriptional regulator [Luteolibacter sp. SL250]